MKTINELLKQYNADKDFINWANNKKIETIVENCHKGDWLIWLAKKTNVHTTHIERTKVK